MSKFGMGAWAGALGLALAAASAARAETIIDFTEVAPVLFSNSVASGEVAKSKGFVFESDGFGFSGVDDMSDPAVFVYGNAPTNAKGKGLFALNSDGIGFAREDGGAFMFQGFNLSFIAPLGGIGPDLSAGQLVAVGTGANGKAYLDRFDFLPSDADGNFNFSVVDAFDLRNAPLVRVDFFACVFDDTGLCSFSGAGAILPQFALDNLRIPEPAALSLAAVGLFAAGAARRRRAQA